MRAAIALAAISVAGCSAESPRAVEQSIGEICGIPDLEYAVDEEARELKILEHEIEGTMRNEAGDVYAAPPSDREMMVLEALPCLAEEAERRGLRLNNSERPMIHVDA